MLMSIHVYSLLLMMSTPNNPIVEHSAATVLPVASPSILLGPLVALWPSSSPKESPLTFFGLYLELATIDYLQACGVGLFRKLSSLGDYYIYDVFRDD